jgi:hypothetical protein
MPGIPAAGAPAPARATAQPEVAIATARSTDFRAALGDVTLRRKANRCGSAESDASRAAPARAKPVAPRKAASGRSRGLGRSDRRDEPADVSVKGERDTTRPAGAEPADPEEAASAAEAAPSDKAKQSREGAPAKDDATSGGAKAAALAGAAASAQSGPVDAADAAVAGETEPPSHDGRSRGVGITATSPAVEDETARASTAAGNEEAQADGGTDGAAELLEALESVTGLKPEADKAAPPEGAASGDAVAAHPAPSARPVAARLKGEEEGGESGADGDAPDASGQWDGPPDPGRMAIAAESSADASAPGDATATADKPYARAAEAHPAADAPVPLFDAAPRTSAPDVRHAPAAPPPPPEVRFAEVNHPKLITAVRTELLPDGGSMQIRLDPPQLGDLLVSVEVRAGVVTASFQTSNDDATRLLSHSLADLKGMLEQQGVTVDRLQVRQSPRDESSGDARQDRGQGSGHAATAEDRHSARRDQHRRDLIQKMWDKLAGRDPLDLVA